MRASQIVVVGLGLVVAAVMVALGLWQMQVFMEQGTDRARERAQLPPVPLASVVSPPGEVCDGYGRPVIVRGHYLPEQQIVARDADGSRRVVAAVQLEDDTVIAVVLGSPVSGQAIPIARGPASVTGVLLASDGVPDPPPSLEPGEVDGVRLSALVQMWPQPLVAGYVTVDGEQSAQWGLDAAPIVLPEGDGSMRNEGYAVQWWVFAAFAVLVSIKVARDLGRRDDGRHGPRTMGSRASR